MAFAGSRAVYNFLTKELGIKILKKNICFLTKIIGNRKLREVRTPYFAYGLDEQ